MQKFYCRVTGCFCDSKLGSCVIERKTKHNDGNEDYEFAYCMREEEWECAPPGAEDQNNGNGGHNTGGNEGGNENQNQGGNEPNEEKPSNDQNMPNDESNKPGEKYTKLDFEL